MTNSIIEVDEIFEGMHDKNVEYTSVEPEPGEIYISTPDSTIYRSLATAQVFLAGTIDDGSSYDWQRQFIKGIKEGFKDLSHISLNISNPRVDNWNTKATDSQLETQINWELNELDKSTHVVVNILEDSSSIITMMELGYLSSAGKKVYVCCSEKFHRYMNVKIMSERSGFMLFNSEYATLRQLNIDLASLNKIDL